MGKGLGDTSSVWAQLPYGSREESTGLTHGHPWAGFLSLVVTAQCGLALKIKAPPPGSLPACPSGLF